MRYCLEFFSVLFLLVVYTQRVYGQKSKHYQISCTVIDSTSQEPITAVAVAVYDERSNSITALGTTNEEGEVHLSATLSGDSTKISISLLGYQEKILEMALTDADIPLGTVLLTPDSIVLEEVQVTAHRQMVKLKGNQMEFNLESVPHLEYMAADEIIDYLPFIQIDEEGVKMMGELIRILINNRPHAIYSDPSNLKLLPPHAIERIELTLVPSAGFDSDQKVMNIILKKNYFLGWNGRVSISGSRLGASPQARLSYWGNRFGIDLSAIYSYGVTYRDIQTDIRNLETHTWLRQQKESTSRNQSTRFFTSIYYKLDSMNTIDFQLGIRPSSSVSQQNIWINHLNNNISHEREENSYENHRRGLFSHFNLNYTHKYKKEGNAFYLLTQYSDGSEDNQYQLQRQEAVPFQSQSYLGRNAYNEFTLQLDQQHYANEQFQYLYGGKLIQRWYNSHHLLETIESRETIDTTTADFQIRQLVSTAYVDAEWQVFKYRLHSGLRLEYAQQHYQTPDYADTSYVTFIPNVSISRNLAEQYTILFSYYRKLLRPGFDALTPFVISQTAYEQRTGSASLLPQYSNRFSLQGYGNFQFGSLGLNLNYSRIRNSLNEHVSTAEDSAILRTDINVNLYEAWDLGFSAEINLFKKIRWSHFSSMAYSQQSSGTYFQHMWGGYLSEKITFELPHKQRVSVNLRAFSPNLLLQGQEQVMAYPSTDISYSHYFDLLKKYPSGLSVSLSNLWLWKGLPGYRKQSGPDFSYYQKVYRANSYVGVSLQISLVGKQYGRKSFDRSRSIQNDDLNNENSQ